MRSCGSSLNATVATISTMNISRVTPSSFSSIVFINYTPNYSSSSFNSTSLPQNTSLPPPRRRRRRRKTIINSLLHTGHHFRTHHHQLVHVWNRPNNIRPSSLSLHAAASASASLDLPLLPFPLDQVLVPSESKTLHLYEARYLKLLDESLHRKSRLFVHFVLDPIVISTYIERGETPFAARYGCLVLIEKVEQLDIGALVTIRGIGRVTLVKFVKADPFIEGIVIPLQDNVPENTSEVDSKVLELKEALQSLNSLEIKLKAAKDALLQTKTANSLKWAENESFLDSHKAFIPSFAERVSFAALQLVTGSSESELIQLQKEKLKAMDAYDTLERLENSLKLVKENVSVIAAKLAIQSLNLQ